MNNVFRFSCLLIFLLAISSCQKKTGESQLVDGRIIVGEVDWTEIRELGRDGFDQFKEAKKVAYIDIPMVGSRCTGFLISPDVLMTNHHCITQEEDANGVTATFNYEKGATRRAKKKSTFFCGEFLANNKELDFALLKCARNPGLIQGQVKLLKNLSSGLYRSQDIYIVHQNCDYYMDPQCKPNKKLSEGEITRLERGGSRVFHNADTLGGSSGSPIFSAKDHEVVGLHNSGYGGDDFGRGKFNGGIKMPIITSYIKKNLGSLKIPGLEGSDPTSGTDRISVSDNQTYDHLMDSIQVKVKNRSSSNGNNQFELSLTGNLTSQIKYVEYRKFGNRNKSVVRNAPFIFNVSSKFHSELIHIKIFHDGFSNVKPIEKYVALTAKDSDYGIYYRDIIKKSEIVFSTTKNRNGEYNYQINLESPYLDEIYWVEYILHNSAFKPKKRTSHSNKFRYNFYSPEEEYYVTARLYLHEGDSLVITKKIQAKNYIVSRVTEENIEFKTETSKLDSKNYNYQIYVSAKEDILRSIDQVTYTLKGSTIRPITIDTSQDKFAFNFYSWKKGYEVMALVELKKGKGFSKTFKSSIYNSENFEGLHADSGFSLKMVERKETISFSNVPRVSYRMELQSRDPKAKTQIVAAIYHIFDRKKKIWSVRKKSKIAPIFKIFTSRSPATNFRTPKLEYLPTAKKIDGLRPGEVSFVTLVFKNGQRLFIKNR